MRRARPTERAVLACVRGTPVAPALAETGMHDHRLADVVRTARDHQVTAYVHRALRGTPGAPRDDAVVAWLQHTTATTAMQQLRAMADLRSVEAALSRADVRWFLMKGPVLAQRVYPAPSLRPCRDLDVVVPAGDFAAAIAALETGGARLLDANWDLAISGRRGQVHVRLPQGTTLDLHWHLINAGRTRDVLDISMASVWRDLRTVALRGLQVDTLSVTDTVVHLGIHAALGGAWRLRWLNDLKLVLDHETVDWVSVVARARQWRAGRMLGVTLLRSSRLLGADVPDHVLTALTGSRRYRCACDALDRLWSPVSATRSWAPARMWPQFARDAWPDTLRAVTWRMRRRAGHGVRGFEHGRERPEMMTPSGGDRGRERYVRLVERGALDGERSAPALTPVPVGARPGR